MKNSSLVYNVYPHSIWASEIIKILNSDLIIDVEDRRIYDVPSGNGVISYLVKRKLKKLDFYLYDIEDNFIKTAKKYNISENIEKQNIFDLDSGKSNSIWLFINSLYCLPNGEKAIENFSSQMEYIIGIFPDINHINYHAFLSSHPEFNNPTALTQEDTIKLFEKYGYTPIKSKDLTYIHYHRIKPQILRKLLIRFLTPFDNFFSNNKPSYFLVLFKREVKDSNN